MTRITKLGLQRLDFLPMPAITLLRPARGRIPFLLEAQAGGPLTLSPARA